MKLRRIISLALTLALVLALTGCGSGEKKTTVLRFGLEVAPDTVTCKAAECFVLLFNGICQRRKSAQHSKSTCNCLATRAAVTSAFSFSVLFIACCAATARERMRAGEMYGYADR